MARRIRQRAEHVRTSGIANAGLIAESANELAALVEHCDRHYPGHRIEPDASVPMRGCRPCASLGQSPAGILVDG